MRASGGKPKGRVLDRYGCGCEGRREWYERDKGY